MRPNPARHMLAHPLNRGVCSGRWQSGPKQHIQLNEQRLPNLGMANHQHIQQQLKSDVDREGGFSEACFVKAHVFFSCRRIAGAMPSL